MLSQQALKAISEAMYAITMMEHIRDIAISIKMKDNNPVKGEIIKMNIKEENV